MKNPPWRCAEISRRQIFDFSAQRTFDNSMFQHICVFLQKANCLMYAAFKIHVARPWIHHTVDK